MFKPEAEAAVILRVLAAILCALWIFSFGTISAAQDSAPSVDLAPAQFKAAILSKIAAYVEWPEDAFPETPDKILIGILGEDPFQGLLEALLKDLQVHGRPIVLHVFKEPDSVRKCHILFIPEPQLKVWPQLQKRLDLNGVLTVFDSRDFAKHQGVANLSFEDRTLEIHVTNAKKAGVKINSKLLRISRIHR